MNQGEVRWVTGGTQNVICPLELASTSVHLSQANVSELSQIQLCLLGNKNKKSVFFIQNLPLDLRPEIQFRRFGRIGWKTPRMAELHFRSRIWWQTRNSMWTFACSSSLQMHHILYARLDKLLLFVPLCSAMRCSMVEPCTAHTTTTSIHHVTMLQPQTPSSHPTVARTLNTLIRLQLSYTHAI